MDTPLDTSDKTNKNTYFPWTLENKIVYYPDYEPNNDLEKNKVRKLLQEYIDTKNFDYLFRAIKLDCTILQGRKVNDLEKLNKKNLMGDEIIDLAHNPGLAKKIKLVTPPTVVWESINRLQFFFIYPSFKIIRDKGRDLFRRFGNALVPENVFEEVSLSKDWLMHILPKKEGTKGKMTFMNPEKFYEYYNKVSNLFIEELGEVEGREKRIYSIIKTRFSKELDELKKAQELFHQGLCRVNFDITHDEIDDEIVDRFELTTKRKSIASIVAWVHERLCYHCQQKPTQQVCYSNILKLYKKAEDYVERGKGDYQLWDF